MYRFRFLWRTLLACCVLAGAAHAQTGPRPSWGAIASIQNSYGYAYDQPTRDAAENAARARCDRAAGRPGACVVRTSFDRACAALATGNFGEWGAAIASASPDAGKAAAKQCNDHLPTEPCKVLVSVCSR